MQLDQSIIVQIYFLGRLAMLEQGVTPLPTLWSRTEMKLSGARDWRPEEVYTEPGEQPELEDRGDETRKEAHYFPFLCHGFPCRKKKKEWIGCSHTFI